MEGDRTLSNDPKPLGDTKRTTQDLLAHLLVHLQGKVRRLVEDFAVGQINRTQFHNLYQRYQRQIGQITRLDIDSDSHFAMTEESETTFVLKKRLTAKVLGVSIYNNESSLPIETLGEFTVDPALLVPMLSSYRSATREIFNAGLRSTAMENGQWLCFVAGQKTTLLALFSLEPSQMQLNLIEQMHHDFEDANKAALESGRIDPATLAYPFLVFLRQAHRNARTGHIDPDETQPG